MKLNKESSLDDRPSKTVTQGLIIDEQQKQIGPMPVLLFKKNLLNYWAKLMKLGRKLPWVTLNENTRGHNN